MVKKIVNAIKRSPLANSIALHDFVSAQVDIKGWVDYCVCLFRKYGLEPTRMGITAPSLRSKKMNRYVSEVEKLNQVDLSTITGIDLQATMNGSDNSHGDQIFSTGLSLRDKNSKCVITLDNALVPFDQTLWNEICQNLTNFLKPKYGYGYQREYKNGPECYPSGVIMGLDWGHSEEDLITKWLDAYRMPNGQYKTGDLRDIYPMNVLSQAHKDHVIEGKPFFDWIAEKSYRGSIYSLNENLWAWWVEPEYIPAVREELKPTGWVICI